MPTELPKRVLGTIARCDADDLTEKLIGLGLLPQFHANHPRIHTLLDHALAGAVGSGKLNEEGLANMLEALREHPVGSLEDPAECAFVSLVPTPMGNYRIFNGMFPSMSSNLERLTDAVLSRDFAGAAVLAKTCHSLLILSEVIVRRNGFDDECVEHSEHSRKDWPTPWPPLAEHGRSVIFTRQDLETLAVDTDMLAPFILDDIGDPGTRHYLNSPLSRRPIMRRRDGTLRIPVPANLARALCTYLTDAISTGYVPAEAREIFHASQFNRWTLFDLALRNEKPGIAGTAIPEPALTPPRHFLQAPIRFDEDKIAHFVMLGCDWSSPPTRSDQPPLLGPGTEQAVQAYLRTTQDALIGRNDINAGLTVVVYDSPGWPIAFGAGPDPDEKWFVVALTSHMLSTLLVDRSFCLLDLWKMLRADRKLRAAGWPFLAYTDPLANWSIWRECGYSFWPLAASFPGAPLVLPDTSAVRDVVVPGKIAIGRHSAPTAQGGMLVVERMLGPNSPTEEAEKPTYFPVGVMATGELASVVETDLGPWWTSVARPPFSEEDRSYLYLLWQSTTEWLLRLSNTADGRLGNTSDPIGIELLPVPDTIADGPDGAEFMVHPEGGIVRILLPAKLLHIMAAADNLGERLLVRALAEGLALIRGVSIANSELDAWTDTVVANPGLKMMHVTMSGDAGMAVDMKMNGRIFRPLQRADMSATDEDMWATLSRREDLGIPSGAAKVTGSEAVSAILHAAVDIRWERCRSVLSDLDRVSTLAAVYRMIETLLWDRTSGERAALAARSLYDDIADWALETAARRDVAYRAYRVVAEMANCTCPLTGGRKPGFSDIDQVAAEVTALIHDADNSDAVRFGLTEAGLEFVPTGGFRMVGEDAAQFTDAYIRASIAENIELDIDNYPSLFEIGSYDREQIERDDADGYLPAYEAEFGLSMFDAAKITHALQEACVEAGTDVMVTTIADLTVAIRGSVPDLSENAIIAFMKSFGLGTRPDWAVSPGKPFRADDVMPWHFERRLSLMMRPILIASDDTNAKIVYGVRHVGMGTRYAAQLLETGVWPKSRLSSKVASDYIDAEVNRRGKLFEKEVANLVRAGGWHVFEGQQMKRFGAPATLGDIDVLAVSPDGDIWIVIECKWFGAARTPREIANWLQDYHGKANDKLDRHLRRREWVQQHHAAVANALGVAEPTSVLGRVATTSPVPLSFTDNLPEPATVWTRRMLPQGLRDLMTSSPQPD